MIAKLYAQKHNPFVYFSAFVDNPARMAKLMPDDEFAEDLKGDLAGFTWISPDQCHDMHGISGERPSDRQARLRLSKIRARPCGDPPRRPVFARDSRAIRASPVWKDDTAIVIVWDEDDYAAAARPPRQPDRPQRRRARRLRAPLIVVTSKDTPARKIDAPYNHYNLLATLEAAYGVECLGQACEAKDALIEGCSNRPPNRILERSGRRTARFGRNRGVSSRRDHAP